MQFYWEVLKNIPKDEVGLLRFVFKVALDNQTGFYWQQYEAGYAELMQLQPNRTYTVEVRLGLTSYPNEMVWSILRGYATYTIKTNAIGNSASFRPCNIFCNT